MTVDKNLRHGRAAGNRLARRLGHYGKYSWLIMPAGQGDVVKGNWELAASPLVVTRGS